MCYTYNCDVEHCVRSQVLSVYNVHCTETQEISGGGGGPPCGYVFKETNPK